MESRSTSVPAAVHRDPVDLFDSSFDVLDCRSFDRAIGGQFDVRSGGPALECMRHRTGEHYGAKQKIYDGFEEFHCKTMYNCLLPIGILIRTSTKTTSRI